MSTVLSVDKLCKEYQKFALKDVSFRVEAGSIMGFIGRNGAGKTTLAKLLLDLYKPTNGRIYDGITWVSNFSQRRACQRL